MHNAALRRLPASPAADPPAFEIHGGGATAPILLVCDHASKRVPPSLGGLGLSAQELTRHIGWDIGAAAVTRELAKLLGATAVLSGVSRLVIDCNRPIGDETSVPSVSDGVRIPGNQALDASAVAARAAAWFHPYHDAIGRQIERLERRAPVAALIAVHSFTPVMEGRARPWPVGVLWNRDPRLPVPVIEGLRGQGLAVGDNEPYSGRDGLYTVDRHAAEEGRPHITFEIRQDELGRRGAPRRWAVLLAELLKPLLARPEMAERRSY